MKKIRVMIVEDSRVVRQLLEHLVRNDPRLELAASVGSAEEALGVLHQVAPDVISMDIRLPGMNGFEATQRIMADRPTPIVVVSASVGAEDLQVSMNALRAGALAVVEKPTGLSQRDYAALADRICTQLAIMSQVKVVRQRIDRGLRFGPGPAPTAGNPTGAAPQAGGPDRPVTFRALGVAASTGGPQALTRLLGTLPASFPLPIFLVQHITPAFLDGFATWLETVCPFRVRVAQDREVPRPGHVYLAPADLHLRFEGAWLRCESGPLVAGQRPSGTVLFESMARGLGPAALAVLLTGMGEDGAEGLARVREVGGYTIAEDASTAVVYGMPAAAVRLGAPRESLPLPEIAPRLLELLGRAGAAPARKEGV